MKSSSTVLLTIYVVFNISGIMCAQIGTNNNQECQNLNNQCVSDNDCCSKVCRLSFNLRKYCRAMTLVPTLMSKFPLIAPDFPIECIYNNITNATADDELLRNMGMNAAADHGLLNPGTLVTVIMGNNSVNLMISPHPSKIPGTLELSEMAARRLGMNNLGEQKSCAFQVPFWDNHKILRRFLILLPVSGVIYALYLFNQLNMY